MSDFVWEDDDGGFEFWYEEKSVDPGPSLLIGTIIFCVLSLAILPCLMAFRKRWTRRKSSCESEPSTESDNSPDRKQRKSKPQLDHEVGFVFVFCVIHSQ